MSLAPFAEERLRLRAPARRLRFELVAESLERFGDGRVLNVLDAGCGDGVFAVAIARKHPDWTIVGVDLRAELLDRARARAARSDVRNVEFRVSDLTRDLGIDTYDAVVAIECLEEIEDDDEALARMRDALRRGGLFVAHVPERRWTPAFGSSESVWRDEVRHGYDAAELSARLEALGLEAASVAPTCRTLVRAAQEVSDRIKGRSAALRALALPGMVAAVRVERLGWTWGPPRALLATAVRAQSSPR